MVVEFICKRAISAASLKGMCEKAKTREPAQGKNVDERAQMFQ
jgi:hypothetical protein